jgi:hypothetical protein
MPTTIKTCKSCGLNGHATSRASVCANHVATVPKGPAVDPVTRKVLTKRYTRLLEFEKAEIADDAELGYITRRHGLPDHISENIVKFVIHNHVGDATCTWSTDVGDLKSESLKTVECKSFTSDGPTSFGPTQKWDHIFFLDARNWLTDNLVVWQVAVPNTDPLWTTIKVNKKETKSDQSGDMRRPRIKWESLYPQIKDHCKKVFEGTFEEIFTTKAPVDAPPA